MSQVVKSLRAATDLEDIYVYIGQNNLRAAERFLVAANDAFAKLADFPTMGNPFESNDPQLAGVRTWRIKRFRKYIVFYRPIHDGVEVIRVVHGSRDFGKLFGPPAQQLTNAQTKSGRGSSGP